MGLYDFKEFLNFEDLAEYLTDKGVYNFDITHDINRQKLKDWIINLFNEQKINPVFYYDGLVKEDFNLDSHTIPFRGWIFASKDMIKELSSKNEIDLNVRDYLKVYSLHSDIANSNIGERIEYVMSNHIFMDTNRYKIELPKLDIDENPLEPKTRTKILFDILDDMAKKKKENPELEISLDDYEDKLPKTIKNDIWLTFDDLLYPKADLDKLFNQPTDQATQLQAKIDRLTATNQQQADTIRLLSEQLEAGEPVEPIADKELSPTAQKAVTKLLYSLFREHGYELDGKRKGATNEQLITLTKSHKAEVSRDTIAHWLDRTNALQSDLQK